MRDDPQRLAEEQAALRRVATLVAQGASTEDVFAAVAREVSRVLEVPLVEVSRFEADDTALVVGAYGEHPFGVGTRWPLDGLTITASVHRTGGAVRVDDYAGLPGAVAEAARSSGVRSGVGAPIFVEGSVWGAIAAGTDEAEPLSSDAEVRLTQFTDLVATAIGNAQARDQLRVLADEQAALRRLATVVAQGTAPTEVFAAVAEEVARLLDVPLISMVRYEADRMTTQLAHWGEGHPFPDGLRLPLGRPGIVTTIAQTGKPARVADYPSLDSELAARVHAATGARSAVGAPLIVDGGVWGAIMALSPALEPLAEGTENRLAEFTDLVSIAIGNAQARGDLRRLADEQAALRRVATLVAEGAAPGEVFAAVAEEVRGALDLPLAELSRYEDDGTVTVIAAAGQHPFQPGTRWLLDGPTVSMTIRETGLPARVDYAADLPGAIAEAARRAGFRNGLGVPIVVEGQLWGAMSTASTDEQPLPEETEARLSAFTELVATAVSNALTRAELIASRARIVTATDEARRKIERDLHDGTQQRLVSLALELRAAQANLPAQADDVSGELEGVLSGLDAVLEDVREISRGLHPAILSHAGLPPAIRALARRASMPVEVDIEIDGRPAEPVEVAAYYVASEALANAAKHARASLVHVGISSEKGRLCVRISDDGVGGAEAERGSGLAGLADRVSALGGTFALSSPLGGGTTIEVALPFALESRG